MRGHMWIRQISAYRDDGTVSTIELKPGLNYIIGTSNTGKTRIAKTIGFVCGGDDLPFTITTRYTTASVVFVTVRGEVTLTRSINARTGIQVESSDPDIEPGRYSISLDSLHPINTVLLAMLGINPSRKVLSNEAFKQKAFTWKSVRQTMLVSESRIDKPKPSILLPEKTTEITMTQALSALLVLAQDENFDDAERQESASERSARRKAVARFVYRQLDIIQPRIEEITKLKAQAKANGETIDSYIGRLNSSLTALEKQRTQLLNEDTQVMQRITDLTQQVKQFDVLTTQRKALISQYDADLARLDLQLQEINHALSHPHSDTCQFCHSPITIASPSAQDIKAREDEIARINKLKTGARQDLETASQSQSTLTTALTEARNQHASMMSTIKTQLQPAVDEIKRELEKLSEAEQLEAELAQLNKLTARFNAELDGDNEEPILTDKFKPRDVFYGDFYYSMRLAIRNILQQANFPRPELADFDKESFDITIGGYLKDEEQGKGYCSYLNTVLSLAFHQYLNRRSVHAPGFLLIDTPLHGFDEGNRKNVTESMRLGLIDYFEKQAAEQQMIILENTNHVEGLEPGESINIIYFTKNKNEGRYGYLEGVYDLAEEQPHD